MTDGGEIVREALVRDGFWIERNAVDSATIASLREELTLAHDAARASGISAARGGMRFLLRDFPSARALARSEPVSRVARASVGDGAVAVRGLFFDKTPGANWKVPWHQDRTIAVSGQTECEGFGSWSEKDGVAHVQPPVDLLNEMVAVRVHLDDCGDDNGPLKVLARTRRIIFFRVAFPPSPKCPECRDNTRRESRRKSRWKGRNRQ